VNENKGPGTKNKKKGGSYGKTRAKPGQREQKVPGRK